MEHINSKAPLLSIALFAYNHEKYINQAIDAAFAQDYPRLEIILSDDRSTDGTFDIIKSRVATYNGPHEVRARQSTSNAGTLSHVLEVARETRGDFLVMAAGDDVQLPHRARIIFGAWADSSTTAFSSAWNIIDDQGDTIELHVKPEAPKNLVWKYFTDNRDRRFMSGPTAAYDPRFLKSLPLPRGKVFHEDTVFTFILHTLGLKINYTDTPTVDYRVHDSSYSNRVFSKLNISEIKRHERATSSYAKDTAAYLDYLLNDFLPIVLAERPELAEQLNISFMKAHLRRSRMEGEWVEASFVRRLQMLLHARNMIEAKVMLPRLAGLNALAIAKSFRRSA